MAEENRLRGLRVRRARHDCVAFALGEPDEGLLEREQGAIQPVDRAACPEAEVRRDLVVPRAARVELPGNRPQPLDQRGLEVQMDVLEARVPAQLAALDVAPKVRQAGDKRRDFVVGQDPGSAEAAGVGDRAVEVVDGQRRVDVDGPAEGGDLLVSLLGIRPESPAPKPQRNLRVSTSCVRRARASLARRRRGP